MYLITKFKMYLMAKLTKSFGQPTHIRKNISTLVLSASAGLFISSIALADDVSVYGLEPKAPQILFVLDYSLSMSNNVDGRDRITVLRETVLDLIDTYKDRAEFGIGPMFAATAGGVQWPISDLRIDANYIDRSIPKGEKTGFEIVQSLIQNTELKWGTGTVPAIAESIEYFRGGQVNFGGVDTHNTLAFKPLQWDTALNTFTKFSGFSGNAAAYSPENAYIEGTTPGSKGYCRRLISGTGRQEAPNDCVNLPSTYTVSNCEPAPNSGYIREGFDYGINHEGIRASNLEFEVCEYQHADQWMGANYKSPIENECQSNVIIMVSDGEPANTIPDRTVQTITGNDFASCEDLSPTVGRISGNCGIELANYAANNNLISGNDKSKLIMHTVGFGIGSKGAAFLENIATAGNGEYHPASNANQLFNALDSLITNLLPETQQFTNFSVDVDRASFSHDNRAYIPLFTPSDTDSWAGNIKGYFIGDEGLEDIDGNPALETVDGVTKFRDTARSFWSSGPDGNTVQSGGASSKIDPTARNLLTYPNYTVPPQGVDLTSSELFKLSDDNPLLLPQHFGYANRIDKPALIEWIHQAPMGEPLHSNTVIANYAGNKRVLFAITNQGLLHAIDASTPVVTGDYTGGEELFAYMPFELIKNIEFLKNGGFVGEHIYGLDGSITPIHNDENNDGIVNGTDTLVIVFGMRRGGKSYFAMDVTVPTKPKLVWQITGENPYSHPDFVDLSQTWSDPQLITAKRGSVDERVLVFGGGYDDNVDDKHIRTASNGNSVFMVDTSGNKIWSASHPDMLYGIPSSIRVIDSDKDSVADRLYFGDLGGQVWRVDFDDVSNSASFKISKLADVSSNGYQPFFYPPSISRDPKEDRLFVAIGSGNRDNPIKDVTKGALYMLHDNFPDAGAPDGTFATIGKASLVNVTSKAAASSSELASSKGWVIDLKAGEKSLSPLVTINGDLLATTFQPSVDLAHNGCEAPKTTSRLYALNISDAGAPNNVVNVEFNTVPVNRFIDLEVAGIAPEPYTIIPAGSDTIDVYVGNEKQLELNQTIKTVFWYEK